jgi:hypothetical protein
MMKNVIDLNTDEIVSVYSGKNGECVCGCHGKHIYNSKLVAEGTKRRGYAVTPSEVKDWTISRLLNLMKRNATQVSANKGLEGGMYTFVNGTRLHILYTL